jgi:hypothetical protein
MPSTTVLRVARVVVALLGLSSVVLEVVTLVGRGTFVPSNFLSFFTIQSNLLAAVTLLLVVARPPSPWLSWLRGLATMCMVVTGLVFAVLLSGLPQDVLTAVPWDNTVLHQLVPLWFALDWALDPPAPAVPLRRALLWLLYPLAYVAYSLVRGPIVGWYPYPFLDPATGGYGAVALTCVGIAVLGVVLVLLLTWWDARRAPDQVGPEPLGAGGG